MTRGFGGHQFVPMIRHRDHHRINVLARQQFAVIVIRLAVLVLIMIVHHLDCVLQMIRVQIARRDHLTICFREKRLGISRPLPTHADHAEVDAVGRAVLTKNGTGHDHRQGNRRPGGGDKMTTTDFRVRIVFHKWMG